MDDPRFRHVATDPRFKSIPKRARKVAIDARFQSMFSAKAFKVKYAVDKRGRKLNQTSNEDLRRYYQLDDSADAGKSPDQKSDDITALPSKEEEESDDVIDSEGESASSTSSESEEEEIVLEGEGAGHQWAEPDPSVAFGESTSRRLALCNMDWDHISAEDIFVLLSSFKPRGGTVLSVAIYPSDFGLERMSQEDVAGPAFLPPPTSSSSSSGSQADGCGYSQEALRRYQMDRLRYCYAVVECDSVATAECLYSNCERAEYEHSGGCLDLRFVPDDMEFDDREPKAVATETTIPADHTPVDFISTALQQSKVNLTWDETDSRRLQSTMKNFTKEDLTSMDFSAYLASSDSDGSEDGDDLRAEDEVTSSAIDKYRALLLDLKSAERKEEEEEIEISWEPGLKETAAELVKRKRAGQAGSGLELKKSRKKNRPTQSDVLPSNDTEPHSEELGFDDPFFQHDVAMTTRKPSKKAKKNQTSDSEQAKSELELLMVDDEEAAGKQHFNLGDLLKKEKEEQGKGGGRRRRRRKGVEHPAAGEEGFKVDVEDTRFSALYHSHSFAPDPTHPQYKATRGMKDIMAEKQRRLVKGVHQLETVLPPPGKVAGPAGVFSDPSVGVLVSTVRAKATSFNRRRKKAKS